MKASFLSLTLVAGLAAAQDLGDIPSCAQDCVKEYVGSGKIADCGPLDIKCICGNSDFISGISCCLEDACDDSGLEDAISFAKDICSGSGVDVPDSPQCNASKTTSASSDETSETASSDSNSDDDNDSAADIVTGGVVGAVAAMLFAL
ncbi:hypothetical protein N3K66_001300 [Trichothecium roseum]|uniref:Uncharacterized protein n=1 Tax=Trichothecium roseum TaxID=47278 RepID=A0ACC0VEB9_9HYPO|nr:hypothetical protein N3K66_001300 [Trichothecium roseum]